MDEKKLGRNCQENKREKFRQDEREKAKEISEMI